MKSHPPFPVATAAFLAVGWFVFAFSVEAGPEPDKKPGKEIPGKKDGKKPEGGPNAGGYKGRGGSDPLRNLSAEERERFRNAMRRAWDDPAVLQARDEVKEATIAYQRALTEAIGKTDPEVLALLRKIQAGSESPLKKIHPQGNGPGGRGRPGGVGFRDFEAFITGNSPGFLNGLNEEQREIYRRAREKALKSPEFQEVFGQLRQMRKVDEDLRNKRIELFGRARQTFHVQMLKADERVKDLLPRDGLGPKGPPPVGRPGPPRKMPDRPPRDAPGKDKEPKPEPQ